MKNISTLRYILLNAIYCCAFALTALAQTPTITSLSPTAGPVGSTVTINGTNLDNATSVKFLGDGNITNTLQTGYQYYDVRAVAFSPDGNKIVAYAYPEIKIFDASDGTVLQTITYYNSDLVFLAFTSDGNSVVSVDYYGTVSVWNVNDGTQTISFSTDSDNYTAALSPNGQTIVVPGYYNTRLWNLADGTEIINFGYGDYFKYSVAFTSDGQTLAIGQYGNIALLNVNDGTLLRNISTNYTLLSLTFSSDGTKLFAQDGQTYYSDARIKRWNVSDGTLLNSFLINGSSSNAAFSPDGQTVAFANSGNKIKLFRMYNGTEIETFTKDYAYRLAYSPDGKTLAAAVSNNYPYNTVRLHRMWLDADITANTTDAIEATVPDYAIPAPIIVTTLNGNTMSSQTFTVERPLIEVSTEEMNFSNVQIGESVQKTFMIYNNGWASLECTLNATLPFSALPTTFSVAVGDSQEVTVTFAPTAVNDYNDVIEITHNAGNDPRNVSVFGSGVELLTGTKTVGAGIGRDYSTLQAAFDAISNTGINDSLILSLTDTSYSTTTLELFLPATYNPAVLIIRKTGLAANIKVRDGGFGLDLNVAGSNSVQFDNVTMILRNIDDWEFGVYLHSDDNENTELLSLSGLTISGSNEFYRGIVVANFENPNGKIEVKNNTINTAYTGILVEGFAVPEVAIENNTINLRSEGAEGGIVLEGGYNLSNDNTGSISVSGNTITAPSGYIGIGCYGDFERFNELLVENNTITGSQDADFGDGSIHLDNIIGWYPEDFKTAPNTGEKKQRFTKENRKEYIGTLKEKMLEHKTTLKEEYLKKREEVRTIAKEHDPEKRRALSEQRVEKLKAKIEANKEKHNIFRSVNSGFKSNDMNVHINHNTMSLVRGGGIWFGGDVYGFYETNVYFELKDNTLTQTDFIDGEVYGVFLGNGIFSYEGAVSVTFEGNTANSIGADMYCYPYSISNLEVNVNNNTLTGLYVGADVGTYSEDVVNGSLSGNVVTSRDSVSGGYFNIYVAQSNQQNSGTYTVANNIFNGCSLYVGADDGKITFDVKNNGIKNVPSGYAMYVSSEENVSATIQSNVIADNDYGLYLHTHIQPIIKNNTIIRNRNEGLYIQRSDEPPRLRLNNLYGNGTYDLVNNTSNTVNADSNWWGAATTAEMVANTANITKIYDNRDSSIYGLVSFANWLSGTPPTQTTAPAITGTVYNDLNGNCVKDNNEPGLPGMIVTIEPLHTVTATDGNGTYSFNQLPEGTYSVQTFADIHNYLSCPSATPGTLSGIVVTTGQITTGNDIGMKEETKYRTFKADISLSKTVVKLAYDKITKKLKKAPNLKTAVEHTFYKLGKKGATFLGIANKDSGKTSAWIAYSKAADLGKFFTKAHDSTQAYPMDSTRDLTTGVGKKFLKGGIKPDTKKFNNFAWEQAIAFKLNLIASDTGVTPKGLKDLRLTIDATLVGKNMKDSSLGFIANYLDSVVTYWKRYGLNNASSYAELLTFIKTVIRPINNAFSAELDSTNYLVDSLAIVKGTVATSNKKNPVAITLRGVKDAIDVGIVRRVSGAKSEPLLFSTSSNVPEQFSLLQNYPNPFNPTTTIRFEVGDLGLVSLKIYNVLGQEVATLLNNEAMDEGVHEVEFDASMLSSGVYFYRLVSSSENKNFVDVKKMVLMK